MRNAQSKKVLLVIMVSIVTIVFNSCFLFNEKTEGSVHISVNLIDAITNGDNVTSVAGKITNRASGEELNLSLTISSSTAMIVVSDLKIGIWDIVIDIFDGDPAPATKYLATIGIDGFGDPLPFYPAALGNHGAGDSRWRPKLFGTSSWPCFLSGCRPYIPAETRRGRFCA